MKKVTVLGEGAWGTAVATLLAHNGYEVYLWCHHSELVESINRDHENKRFLSGIRLDKKIIAVASLQEAVEASPWVFEAIPLKFLRSLLIEAQRWVIEGQTWVLLSKGIEQNTLLFPSQIIDEICTARIKTVVVGGPSFAHDVAHKRLTAVTIAAADGADGKALQKLLANDYFRPFITTDMIGVQVGAALKNVITIGMGMLDGAGYADNTKAFLLTRGLQEMEQLNNLLGGRPATIYGLSGVGDLLLSSRGTLSRNLLVGRRLGAGEALPTIVDDLHATAEGINTVAAIYQLMKKRAISLPLCQGIYEVMYEGKTVTELVRDSMVGRGGFEYEE